MKKLFITGGLGYIGSKLAKEAVKMGFEVCVYDSLLYEQDIDVEPVKLIIGDTRDSEKLKKALVDFKPDFLFHFAELVGIHICEDNPEYTKEINYDASKAVVDLAEELNIPTVYNSTSSVYGNQKNKTLLKEDAALPEASDNYVKYKLMMEKYINEKISKNPNFKIIMLRLATVCGLSPRMRLELLPNHFTYCAVAKGLIKISEPEAFRAQISTDDLIDAYFAIIKKENWPKRLYNLGHHNLSKIKVAETIQSIVPCRWEPVGNLGDPRNLQIDSSSFYEDFDWQPRESFEQTVQTTAKWIKDNLKEIEETKFKGIINSPLERWLKMI